MPPRLPHPPWRYHPRSRVWGEPGEKASAGWGMPAYCNQRQGRGLFAPSPSAPPPQEYITHGPVSDDTPRMRLSPGIATTAPPGGGGGGRRPGGVGVYCNQRKGRGACPPVCPTPTGVYHPRSRVWGRTWRKGRRGVGDAGILQPETGEGAFCPLPVCPTPVEMSPRSSVWGEPEEGAGAGVYSPGYGLSPGIAMTAPAPRGDASHGPVSDDTPRMRPSPGIAMTAPPGGGGGGQRPGGVGVYCNQRQERGACPPVCPTPRGDVPTVQGMGRTWRKGRRGMGDAGILQPETGEGAFCPLPVCPTPRGDVPHGPVSDDTPRMRLSLGLAMTAPPGGRGRRRDEPGGVGDAGILRAEKQGRGACPSVCPTPVEMPLTVQCLMIRPGCGFP
jgi:hypothetical protein